MHMKSNKPKVLLVGGPSDYSSEIQRALKDEVEFLRMGSWFEAHNYLNEGISEVGLVITHLYVETEYVFTHIKLLRHKYSKTQLPILVYFPQDIDLFSGLLIQSGANDFYQFPRNKDSFIKRARTLIQISDFKKQKQKGIPNEINRAYFLKRPIDILLSGTALLMISPILILVAILIKLDSKGPVFYVSKRVGSRYKIFQLYKFRTMKVNADKDVDKLKHLNAYQKETKEAIEESDCAKCWEKGDYCSPILYKDGELICEKLYNTKHSKDKKNVFMKFKNDPRVTSFGAFLRKTSIDELPQLINIFLGDMSIVGNRPLPLYEAEKLTNDQASKRFLAPAGLTGLWQVNPNKDNMTMEERMKLDNQYASKLSLWIDLKIMFRTIPAVFQSSKM